MTNSKDRHQFIDPMRPVSVLTCMTTQQVVDWGLTAIGAPYAWRFTKGQGVRVAVLDTGVAHHPDLDANVVIRQSADNSWQPLDLVGHGTHCAGIIAAVDNGVGVVGVAPKSKVISIKVLGDDGTGSYDSIALGLKLAMKYKAQVISMSLGTQDAPPDGELQALITAAACRGIIVVCASGNDFNAKNPTKDTMSYPAKCMDTIPVAAIDPARLHAPFSSTGQEMGRGISMPGVNIYSTYLNSGYCKLSGTSMATPMLAGFIALMLAYHSKGEHKTPIDPPGSPSRFGQVWNHLRGFAKPLGDDRAFGIGVVDGSRFGIND